MTPSCVRSFIFFLRSGGQKKKKKKNRNSLLSQKLVCPPPQVTSGAGSGVDLWVRMKGEAKAKLEQSHFEVLGIDANASPADLKKAHILLCVCVFVCF